MCDRCLASTSATCTYIGRKRRRHGSPSPPGSSPSEPTEAIPQHSTEGRQLEGSVSSNASINSIAQYASSAPASAPQRTTSTTIVEPLPTPTSSDLPCEMFEEFTDLDEFKQGQMHASLSANFDWSLIDNMHSPVTPTVCASPRVHGSLAAAAEHSQGRPKRDRRLALRSVDQQLEPTKPTESRTAAAAALYFSQPAGKSIHCECLSTMTQLLEDIDSGADTTGGIDTVLMNLGRGIKVFTNVLACIRCNACSDNAMLFATIAQQLVSVAEKVSSRLLLVHHHNHHHQYEGGGRDRDANNNYWKSYGFAEMRDDDDDDDGIRFGSYRIELPEMKVRLVHKMVLLHFEDLQKLMANMNERVRPKRGARAVLADAESKVAKVCWMIQELSKAKMQLDGQ